MKPLSLDLRQRIVNCYNEGKYTQMQVADRFSVSLSSVKKLVYQYREKKNVAYGYDRVGRKPKITSEYKEKIIQLLQENLI